MSVFHILKDGSIITDITGRVVRMEDANSVYQLIDRINQNRSKKYVHKKQEVKVC